MFLMYEYLKSFFFFLKRIRIIISILFLQGFQVFIEWRKISTTSEWNREIIIVFASMVLSIGFSHLKINPFHEKYIL